MFVRGEINLADIIEMSAVALLDFDGCLRAQANASITVQPDWPIIGFLAGLGTEALVFVKVADDEQFAIFAVSLPLIGQVGVEFDMETQWPIIPANMDRIEPIPTPPDMASAPLGSDYETFEIDPGVRAAIFRATGTNGLPDLVLTDPLPTVIDPDYAATSEFVDYYENDLINEAFYVVSQPLAGEWIAEILNGGEVGDWEIQLFVTNEGPTIEVTSQTEDETPNAQGEVTITWTDYDEEMTDDATVGLYYDSDREGGNGAAIYEGILASDDTDSQVWDTSAMPTGAYYVYAVIDDGKNPPAYSYSVGRVLITNPNGPDAPTGLTGTPGEDSITLRWNPVTGASTYKVYWTYDAWAQGYPHVVGVSDLTTYQLSVPNGREYRIAVSAVAEVGDEEYEGPQSVPIYVDLWGYTNNAPVITSMPRTHAQAGEAYTYQVTAQDMDGDALSYAVVVTGTEDPPAGMAIAADGLIEWTPTSDDVGIHPLTVTVEDGRGGSDEQAFVLLVQSSDADNIYPEIISVPVASAAPETTYTYDVDAQDLDGDTLSYELVVAPTDMTIDGATGLITWAIPGDGEGSHRVEVQVTDGNGGWDNQQFLICVDGSAPSNLTWVEEPYAKSPTSIGMQVRAEDPSGPVDYEIRCSTTATVRTWLPEPFYTHEWLEPNTYYEYVFRARDRISPPHVSGDSATAGCYTQAMIPAAPVLENVTDCTADVTVQAGDGNPDGTEYAIRNLKAGKYIAADGSPVDDAVWQTRAGWGTVTATGLPPWTLHEFVVYARNGDGIETDASIAVTERTTGVKGDFDRNGAVESPDFPCFTNVYGRSEGDPGWEPDGVIGDFDDDGDVDFADFMEFVDVYGP